MNHFHIPVYLIQGPQQKTGGCNQKYNHKDKLNMGLIRVYFKIFNKKDLLDEWLIKRITSHFKF